MSGARVIGLVAVRAIALLGLWIALVDKTERWEVLAGVVSAVIAAWVSVAVQRAAGLRFAVRPRWVLRGIATAPSTVLGDCARVLWAIVTRRPATGRLRAVPFPAAGREPLDRGRRATALALGSIGPNQYAVTESGEDGVLVVHELVPTGEVTAADLVDES
jgi:hypothetical protein